MDMDDVEIEDVNEDGEVLHMEQGPVRNQDLSFPSAVDLLSEYGWLLLAATVLVYLLIHYLNKRRSSQSSSSPPSPATQDAVLVSKRQEAMEAARRKMQDELDAKAALYKEKQKEQEEEKIRQKIEIWESIQQGRSYKGSTKHSQATEEASASPSVLKPKTDKKRLRSDDYNPLTGQGGGGSCSYRPGRRGPSSGG